MADSPQRRGVVRPITPADRIAKRWRDSDPSRLVNFIDEATMGTILDQVIRAIEESGITRYELAKRTGVSESALSRLVRGERSISVETLERLAEELGLELRISKKKSPRK